MIRATYRSKTAILKFNMKTFFAKILLYSIVSGTPKVSQWGKGSSDSSSEYLFKYFNECILIHFVQIILVILMLEENNNNNNNNNNAGNIVCQGTRDSIYRTDTICKLTSVPETVAVYLFR